VLTHWLPALFIYDNHRYRCQIYPFTFLMQTILCCWYIKLLLTFICYLNLPLKLNEALMTKTFNVSTTSLKHRLQNKLNKEYLKCNILKTRLISISMTMHIWIINYATDHWFHSMLKRTTYIHYTGCFWFIWTTGTERANMHQFVPKLGRGPPLLLPPLLLFPSPPLRPSRGSWGVL